MAMNESCSAPVHEAMMLTLPPSCPAVLDGAVEGLVDGFVDGPVEGPVDGPVDGPVLGWADGELDGPAQATAISSVMAAIANDPRCSEIDERKVGSSYSMSVAPLATQNRPGFDLGACSPVCRVNLGSEQA